jgi:hypothetical protein
MTYCLKTSVRSAAAAAPSSQSNFILMNSVCDLYGRPSVGALGREVIR